MVAARQLVDPFKLAFLAHFAVLIAGEYRYDKMALLL